MARLGILGVFLFIIVIIAGLSLWYEYTVPRMTLEDALVVASLPGSACRDKGTLAGTGIYNANSQTWWLDWKPSSSYEQPGCNPACVVDATSSAVDVNWRCAGATLPVSHGDLITVASPLPGTEITSPLIVTGEARGSWYFEAQFPVKLYDANGTLLGSAPAQASGNWMTTAYVPFMASITFAPSATATGTLVLEKDNPSGLPQNADQLVVPVSFAQQASFEANGNLTTGGSGQKPNTWYLAYDELGAPARSVELNFSKLASVPALTVGEWVHVVGGRSDSGVVVRSITPAGSMSLNVRLFYYNPALDQGAGGAQCSRQGLVAVDRTVPQTNTPLADTVRLLLLGRLSATERAQGITTEFPLSGFALQSATITKGVAILTFADPQDKTSGGSCRAAVLWAQIEATAKQFPSVRAVQFKPETLFQP